MKLIMTLEEFENIEVYPKAEYLTFNHFEALLNPFLSDFEINYPLFSVGQKALYCMGTLSGQIGNGGLYQFFFNKTDIVHDTRNAIITLKENDLLTNFDKAFNIFEKAVLTIMANKNYSSKFINSLKFYSLLKKNIDLDWFDEYFYEYEIMLQKNLLNYIKSNPYEFIEK
jgi:hypothetical protein